MHRHRNFFTITSIIIVAIIMLGLSAYKQSEIKHDSIHASDVAVKQNTSSSVLNDENTILNASPSPLLKSSYQSNLNKGPSVQQADSSAQK